MNNLSDGFRTMIEYDYNFHFRVNRACRRTTNRSNIALKEDDSVSRILYHFLT